jgi:hypothetical protein
MRIAYKIWILVLSLVFMTGCAGAFKLANVDPATGRFPTSVEVDKKYIKIFRLVPGVQETNYVYLRAASEFGGDRFYDFMKDALQKIGFKKIYSQRELSQFVVKSGLSQYVTSISDLVSLNNLAKAAGPFLIIECRVFRVSDVVFRFDLQLIDPLTGETSLEISRIRTNWLDMDSEINYPILNVIKQWYDESAKLPYEKPKKEPKGKTARNGSLIDSF